MYLYLLNVFSIILYRNLIRIVVDCNISGSFLLNLERVIIMINIIYRVIVNLNSCRILYILYLEMYV